MPPRCVRPVVEGLQELVPVGPVLLARRVNGIERDDVAVPACTTAASSVLVNEIRAERHVAAEPVLLVVGVGPVHVVLKILA